MPVGPETDGLTRDFKTEPTEETSFVLNIIYLLLFYFLFFLSGQLCKVGDDIVDQLLGQTKVAFFKEELATLVEQIAGCKCSEFKWK